MQDYRAPVSEDRLRASLDDPTDPWCKTFDLLFRNNPAITDSFNCYAPAGFAKLNSVQQQFVGFDEWYGRLLNGGFEAAFGDPESSVVAAYVAIPILGWPELEERLEHAFEIALKASRGQILDAVKASDVWKAASRLLKSSGWEADRLTADQLEACDAFQVWFMQERQDELDRRVLASIWRHRGNLVRQAD